MALENTIIQEKLVAAFGNEVFNFEIDKDIFTFEIAADINKAVILFLKNDPILRFHFLTDLCGIHYPKNEEERTYCVVYHMHNWYDNKRILIKTYINQEKPDLKTISNIFACSNWMEREAYDFYGINFIGHPQLKRILNMDEMTSFPMRKEFPLEDQGRTDKDDRFFGRTRENRPVNDQATSNKL